MFREYAIEPEAISTWEQFRFLDSLFGWSQGRLISELPSSWRLDVIKNIHRPIEQAKVTEKMRNWHLLNRKASDLFNSTEQWFVNALVEHGRLNFEKIVVKNLPTPANHLLDFDDFDSTTLHSPDGIVPRQAKDMALAMKLLLQTGKVIKFIDPHFDLTKKRFLKPFTEFVQTIVASPYKRDSFHIEIYTGAKHEYEANEKAKDITLKIGSLTKLAGIKIFIYILKNDQMHNRYVMSELTGVTWPNGLDESSNQGDNDCVSIMQQAEYDKLFKVYSATCPIRVLDSRVIH